MTAPTDDMDGDAIPPPIARVLLLYREAIAVATERAYLDLQGLGIADPAVLINGRVPRGRRDLDAMVGRTR